MTISITLLIIIVTSIVSYIGFSNEGLFNRYSHQPYMENRFKEYDRLVSSGFLHVNMTHLIMNMFVFYQFGQYVEAKFMNSFGVVLGSILYLLLYISAIVVADIPTMRRYKDNSGYAAVGASGAVAAILFAFIIFLPWSKLGVFFVIEMPAVLVGILYLAYEHWAGANRNDNVGHDAHIMGALYGVLFIFICFHGSLSQFTETVLHRSPYW